ncbi:aspartic proteinase-like protein 2 [Prunus yedoensis var. nudiflora]|uniref:Aspartic proteinase-like protein 2 n=1 Tax=Prunus yedoensis var. nudiflora TaxID=2094558 RepID=A0A314YA43_PRUYE|nr:aspartic proteinase-like protein 2 [Prunus yedoensis var. nudiflora]
MRVLKASILASVAMLLSLSVVYYSLLATFLYLEWAFPSSHRVQLHQPRARGRVKQAQFLQNEAGGVVEFPDFFLHHLSHFPVFNPNPSSLKTQLDSTFANLQNQAKDAFQTGERRNNMKPNLQHFKSFEEVNCIDENDLEKQAMKISNYANILLLGLKKQEKRRRRKQIGVSSYRAQSKEN